MVLFFFFIFWNQFSTDLNITKYLQAFIYKRKLVLSNLCFFKKKISFFGCDNALEKQNQHKASLNHFEPPVRKKIWTCIVKYRISLIIAELKHFESHPPSLQLFSFHMVDSSQSLIRLPKKGGKKRNKKRKIILMNELPNHDSWSPKCFISTSSLTNFIEKQIKVQDAEFSEIFGHKLKDKFIHQQ